jgi:hypothetical protein
MPKRFAPLFILEQIHGAASKETAPSGTPRETFDVSASASMLPECQTQRLNRVVGFCEESRPSL